MKTYSVYFQQINADRIEVQAKSELEARRQAMAIWRRQTGPEIRSVAEHTEPA